MAHFLAVFSIMCLYDSFEMHISEMRRNVLEGTRNIERNFGKLICTARSLQFCRLNPFVRTLSNFCGSLAHCSFENKIDTAKNFIYIDTIEIGFLILSIGVQYHFDYGKFMFTYVFIISASCSSFS